MAEQGPKNAEMIKDASSSEQKGVSRFGAEVVKNQNNTELLKDLQDLESAFSHDTPVIVEQARATENALDAMKVVVGGDEMTVGEMNQIPDLEKNMKTWKQIEVGKFGGTCLLTHITAHVAKLLSCRSDRFIDLGHLTFLSDDAAKNLAKHEGGSIGLNDLVSISDKAAMFLAQHRPGGIIAAPNILQKIKSFKLKDNENA